MHNDQITSYFSKTKPSGVVAPEVAAVPVGEGKDNDINISQNPKKLVAARLMHILMEFATYSII